MTLGLNTNLVAALGEDQGEGIGVDIYLGKRFDLKVLTLDAELSGGVQALSGEPELRAQRLVAGGRVGLGAVIRPIAFAHLGVGQVSYEPPVGSRLTRSGLAADVGVGLDFTLLPLLDIGVHASYNVIELRDRDDAFKSVVAGGHLTLVF